MMQKTSLNINFAQGLDTKTDPWQVEMDKFLVLENIVFTKGLMLEKRNGNANLINLAHPPTYLTTFNGDLTAIGSTLSAYSTSNQSMIQKGNITPLTLSTLPLIRNNLNQSQGDSVTSLNGLTCTVYTEVNNGTNTFKYQVSDATTGQNIQAPTALASAEPTYGTPKVYLLGSYFIIIYSTIVTASYHLVYQAIPITSPNTLIAAQTITTSYTPATSVAFDAYLFNNTLYIAWNGASASGIKMATISSTAPGSASPVSGTTTIDAAHVGTIVSVTADLSRSVIWVSYYNLGTTTGYTVCLAPNLIVLTHYPLQVISSGTILNLTQAAQAGVNTIFYEVSNAAGNYVSMRQVTQSSGALSSAVVVLRSVGLASKAFIVDEVIYFLGAYSSTFQPTYFLVNGSLSTSLTPVVVAKLAYQNGGGYYTLGLPSVTVVGSTATVCYLIKDLVEALANSNQSGTTVTGGVYSQTGINSVSFSFSATQLMSTEIGQNLQLSGGYLYGYDGVNLTENGFHLYPDGVTQTNSTTGGFLSAQVYYGEFTYEWTDNQGNAFRSAGSIPVKVDLSGSGTSTNSISWTVPMLRITSKIASPVKIVGYRWSTANQVFYQFTSITAPSLNDSGSDTITIADTLSDASIIGNNILYTTGGVLEDTGAPACSATTLFDDRLWLVTSEDPNLLWFSKQVIESTPVEMSDLLTIYVNPNVSSTGPTGGILALAPMDDKLVLFKKNAINYINGQGPDNTGANNGYSQPTFITSMVGSSNQNSIVFQPEGLMFEYSSGAGNQIWILTRGLQSQYIGAPVEALTRNATVLSSLAVPGTNQVRFDLSSGIRLMYDYYYSQWGVHTVNSISSTLYQDLHTYLSPSGQVFQETPGQYLDGTSPVLINLQTAWINLGRLQGYQRLYYIYLLGQYLSPHLLQVDLSYNYVESVFQRDVIRPDNYSSSAGSGYGDQPAPFGSEPNVEQWMIYPTLGKCQSFKLGITEVYDPSFGVVAGAGLSLSGMNLTVGQKRGTRPIKSSNTVGG